MSSIDDVQKAEAIASALLRTPTRTPAAPAPDNTTSGGATNGDPYAGRYPTAADPRVTSLRPSAKG